MVINGSFNETSCKFSNKKIWKNLLVLSFSFLLLATCHLSMSHLQSTINSQRGTFSLAVLYLTLVVSCLFLPAWAIKRYKEKKTIYMCMGGYCVYILAQFYPKAYILIPAAILVGICAAPMLAAKCTYLTQIAIKYSETTGISSDVILTRFFGIFFLFFQLSNVFGNIISSTVLKMNPIPVYENDTNRLAVCGAAFCQNELNNSISLESEISLTQRYMLSTIYLLCSMLAVVLVYFFMDPLTDGTRSEISNSNEDDSNGSLFIATTRHFLKNPYQILIVPLTIWSGVEQAFFSSDFTAAYVGCGLGVYMIGYVIICYGIADAMGSLFLSYLAQIVGRVPIFTFGAALHLLLITILLEWQPSPNEVYSFFAIAAGWCLVDSIWQTQINALYGALFKDASEAAFSNYRLWESIGFSLSFLYSAVICVRVKLNISIANLCIGMILYYVIELNEKFKFMFKKAI